MVKLGNGKKSWVKFLCCGEYINRLGISRQGQANAKRAGEIHVAGFQLAAPKQAEQVTECGKGMRPDKHETFAEQAGLGQVFHDAEVRRLHVHAAAGDKGASRCAQCGNSFACFGLAFLQPFDQRPGFRGVPAEGKALELAIRAGNLPIPVGVAVGVVQVGAAGNAFLEDGGVEDCRFFL